VRRSASECFEAQNLCHGRYWKKHLLRKLCTTSRFHSRSPKSAYLPLQQPAIPFPNIYNSAPDRRSTKTDQEKAPNQLAIEGRRHLHLHCYEHQQRQSAPAYAASIPRSTTPVSSGHPTSQEAPSVHEEGGSQTWGASDKSSELLPLRWTWTRKARSCWAPET
jgi:hypothetical protein